MPTKVHLVKAMVFPVVACGCDSWIIKKAEHWRTDAFDLCCWKRLESPLDCKQIKPVSPKGNQSWVFIGRTDTEAEAPIPWPPDVKSWLIGTDSDAAKDWGQEEQGTTEDEMIGWHHQINGYEFEQALGDGEGQESLECYSPRGCEESDTTEWLNWTEGLLCFFGSLQLSGCSNNLWNRICLKYFREEMVFELGLEESAGGGWQ